MRERVLLRVCALPMTGALCKCGVWCSSWVVTLTNNVTQVELEGKEEDFMKVNVHATTALLQTAQKQDVSSLLFSLSYLPPCLNTVKDNDSKAMTTTTTTTTTHETVTNMIVVLPSLFCDVWRWCLWLLLLLLLMLLMCSSASDCCRSFQ